LPGHDSHAQGANFDPARSRILLKQAGVQEGTKLEIWQEEANYNADVIGLIQENLRAVGIELQLRVISDRNAYRSALESARVPIRMTRWVADYPDPDNFLYVTFHSKLPVFNVRWRNPEFDRLTEQARVVPDVQERIRLYQRAERIWLEDMPGIILYHNRALVMHQEAVQGCIPHFTQPVVRLKKVWLSC
jgi:oligopeptide transport system substrate-binding protein